MSSKKDSGGSRGTEWEGYSNYQEVSSRISKSVFDAIDAYAWLQGAHQERTKVNPQAAADARADILSAAMPLYVEMKEEKSQHGVEKYDEIIDKWSGDDGYITKFHEAQLSQSCPGWMLNFIIQIRKAGWSLGYLQAGRRSKQDPDDPAEAEVQNMFEGM